MKSKIFILNMSASIISFLISMGVSFLLTPFIVNRLGAEAYGFIGLINNLISYASIVTVALNSMAARFISLKVHKNDKEDANIYFNSVLLGNIIIAIILSVVLVITYFNLEKILTIPNHLINDVKLSFILVSIEFVITLICSIFGVATVVKNRVHLQSLANIKGNIMRVLTLLLLFIFFTPKIYYINISVIIMSIYTILTNIYYTKRLLPEITIKVDYINISAVLELIKSGIWNVLSKLSQVLNTGLDLLLANVFLGANSMGILSISKTIPSAFISFTNVLISVFLPQMLIKYSKNNNAFLLEIKRSFKVMTFFTSFFIAIIVIYSKPFYNLWVPEQSSDFLYILTLLSVFHMPITSGMNAIYSIFTVVNKIKNVSIVLFIGSLINAIVIIVSSIILPDNISIFVIAGTSSFCALMIMLFYSIPYATKCLNLDKTIFIRDIFFCILACSSMVLAFLLGRLFIDIQEWKDLIIGISISSIIGLFVASFIFLTNRDRREIAKNLFISSWKLSRR